MAMATAPIARERHAVHSSLRSGRATASLTKPTFTSAKVLSDQGSGSDGGILAGIDWAIANRCQVISMSLGAEVPTTTTFYETAGQRALNAGSLIVAAAGNNANRPQATSASWVGRPTAGPSWP